MKLAVTEFVGPNAVLGKTAKGIVRARIAINKRPEVGDEITRPDGDCREVPKVEAKPAEPKPDKAEKAEK